MIWKNLIGSISETINWKYILVFIGGIIMLIFGVRMAKKLLWLLAILVIILTFILVVVL